MTKKDGTEHQPGIVAGQERIRRHRVYVPRDIYACFVTFNEVPQQLALLGNLVLHIDFVVL